MFRVEKSVPVFALTIGLLLAFIMPAHSFSIITPVERNEAGDINTQKRHYPLAAFAGDSGGSAEQGNFLLTKEEIQHVKWCAQRYMSYHAVDNTYKARSGERMECQSPY